MMAESREESCEEKVEGARETRADGDLAREEMALFLMRLDRIHSTGVT
jgi:hypothetical protein